MAATAELFDDAVLGRWLPPRVESLIREAGLLYDKPLEARRRLALGSDQGAEHG